MQGLVLLLSDPATAAQHEEHYGRHELQLAVVEREHHDGLRASGGSDERQPRPAVPRDVALLRHHHLRELSPSGSMLTSGLGA
jgi:hypothetical protein